MHGKIRKALSILTITALFLMNGSWALASGHPQGRSALGEVNHSAERSFAVPQRDKSQVPGARKKLSTDLLSLVDESYMPSGQTGPGLRRQMEGIGQFRQAPFARGIGEAGDGQVYVYIYLKPSARTSVVDPYVSVKSRDESKHYVAGWVDVSDIDSLAAMSEVHLRTYRATGPRPISSRWLPPGR